MEYVQLSPQCLQVKITRRPEFEKWFFLCSDVHFDNPNCNRKLFFEHMDEYYTVWHPDHSVFRWKKGRGLKPGVEFYFEEVIDGKLMKKTVRFTDIQPCSYIEFTPVWWLMRLLMPRLSFTVIDQGTGCLFIAEIVIRTGPAGTWLNRREFNAVQKHMAEEGQNLKTLLENLQKPDSPGEYS